MTPTVVLCMAGHYRRFRDAGYETPKFLLPIDGRPILSWVVDGLGPDRLLLVANQRDAAHAEAVADAVRLGGAAGFQALWIGDTAGQAETADIGAARVEELGWDGPIVFHNVDTLVRGRSLQRLGAVLAGSDGFIDVFDQDSPAYSYVLLDGDRVVDIREKEVISRHATTGLYGFRSAAAYREAAAATTRRSQGEFYISDVYRTLLDRGGDLRADPVGDGHETLVLGTPAEYEAAVAARRA